MSLAPSTHTLTRLSAQLDEEIYIHLWALVHPTAIRLPFRHLPAVLSSEHASCGSPRAERLYLPPISVSTVIGRLNLHVLGYTLFAVTLCTYYAIRPLPVFR